MTSIADEGMWLPYMLNSQNISEMQALGCKLTPEQIFSLNSPSIKDAIVQFGSGCTGELISPNGLLLTNHHCGIGQVQAHSSVDHDYLTDGFWAYDYDEELPNEGLKVSFLSYVEDVTSIIFDGIDENLEENEKTEAIQAKIKELSKDRKGDRSVKINILPFYHGNQYILFEYIVYSDVRLVACPPWGIGKFGADTDNWTWPRHKGDFCIFRVYTDADGNPADYSQNNVPMKSKHYLPISLNGVKEDDFAMILGYPGSTDRYSSSQNVINIIENVGPAIVKCRTTKLDVYRPHMDASQDVFIKYASKQASVSNYWKYYIGQVKQLKRNKVVEKKQALEEEFASWINANPIRLAKYGSVLADFEKQYEILSKYQSALIYHTEAGINGGEAVALSRYFRKINDKLSQKEIDEDYANTIIDLKKRCETFFKNYDVALDKDVTKELLKIFYADVPAELQPALLNSIGQKFEGNFTKYVDKMFEKSVFTSKEKMDKWLDKPHKLDKDPVFALMNDMMSSYRAIIEKNSESYAYGDRASRLYMEALMDMQSESVNFYPDANFTMRLTYGAVKGYHSCDAVTYSYKTTLDGVIAKYIPDNWEFDLPDRLMNVYENKDYGRYADKNGDIVVNFITTNDITGGNSGSPVIDGNGNLIGLAFDGNWEAMSGDISFEQEVQRTICVDARYLIFVIDKIGNAQNIINELTFVK